ncbi:MAG: arrestin family protein [Candidatus Asgardarchaeia archaeon]
MGLFGPKVKLFLETDKDSYFLGEVIHVTVRVETNKAFKANGIRLELICEANLTYRIEEEYYDNTSDRWETRWITESERIKIVNYKEQLYGAGEIPSSGLVLTRDIMIPVEAAPSIASDHIQVRWILKAVIDKRLWKDIVAKKEFIVATFVRGGEYTSQQNISQQFDNKVTVNAVLPRISFVPGESITGILNISSSEYVKFNEVRATLEVLEEISPQIVSRSPYRIRSYENTFKREITKVKIAKDVEILTMGNIQLNLNVPIPQLQIPSYQNPYFTVTWLLKITLSRRFRSDYNLKIPILIVNGVFQ